MRETSCFPFPCPFWGQIYFFINRISNIKTLKLCRAPNFGINMVKIFLIGNKFAITPPYCTHTLRKGQWL